MKRFKRFIRVIFVVMVVYLGSYALLVYREPRRVHAAPGPWPMDARYIPRDSTLPCRESLEQMAEIIFTPLEWLDRQVRPERWEVPPPPQNPPVPREMTA